MYMLKNGCVSVKCGRTEILWRMLTNTYTRTHISVSVSVWNNEQRSNTRQMFMVENLLDRIHYVQCALHTYTHRINAACPCLTSSKRIHVFGRLLFVVAGAAVVGILLLYTFCISAYLRIFSFHSYITNTDKHSTPTINIQILSV